VVKLGLGVIATLTALVLGLLVALAKATYDAEDRAVKRLTTDFNLLDRYLAHYGPETHALRELLPRPARWASHRAQRSRAGGPGRIDRSGRDHRVARESRLTAGDNFRSHR